MLKRARWLVFLFLALGSWAFAQQSSLVGTWAGKVQGYGIEMKLVLNGDGSADFEGVLGQWRMQGNRLLLTQEGETVAYNFTLQGDHQLTLTGGDLMAPMVMTRVGGAAPPAAQAPPPSRAATRSAPQPAAGSRGLSEAEIAELLDSGVSSRRLIDLVGEKGVGFAVTPASASRLKAKGASNELIAALQGASGATEAVNTLAAARPATQPATRARAPQPGGAVSGMQGSRFNHEKWGLSFTAPPGWKVAERQGLLLMGSDTEAGLIVIRLARRATLNQLVQEYGEGMQEEGLQLMPTMAAQDFPAGRNPAVAGELAGMAQDGARIRARTVAVASPFGDAAVVLGMTTEEKYAGLKPRVEAIASSFQFSEPQAPPVLEAIAGQWFYISTSSFGSSERYLNLCSDGRFSENSNIYSTGSAGTAYGEAGGGTAQWSAEGDANQGTVTVTYPNGETSQFQYRSGGGGLYVGGRKYARYGDGSCTKTSVY